MNTILNTKPLHYPEIRGKIYEHGFTYKYVASELGISAASFGKKMNAQVDFTAKEIRIIKQLLNLSNDETVRFFML